MTKSTEIKHKTALVLEGGAMRGMYTAGVLDVFMKKNIKFDAIIGVSAGALFGVNYLSKQPAAELYVTTKNIIVIKIILDLNHCLKQVILLIPNMHTILFHINWIHLMMLHFRNQIFPFGRLLQI